MPAEQCGKRARGPAAGTEDSEVMVNGALWIEKRVLLRREAQKQRDKRHGKNRGGE